MIYLISFLGLLLGYIIASKTKEELIQGKKYFNILASLILTALIIFLTTKIFYIGIEFFIFLSMGITLNYFIKKAYFFLGLTLIISNELVLNLMIFIFGLAYGTLEYIKFKKINYKLILINLVLFIFPIVLLAKKTMIFDNVLIAFIIGGLLFEIFNINSRFKKEKRTSRSR